MDIARLLPRLLLVLVCIVTLFAGLGAGLARMGWRMDEASQGAVLLHGPLMICGFVGTLICLERAVALGNRYSWSLIVPALNAAGAVALLLTGDTPMAKLLLIAGSSGLLVLYGCLLKIHLARYMMVMTVGALCWLIGDLLWLAGVPHFQVVHLWTAFLILTIVGERMELSRVRRLTHLIESYLLAAITLYVAGALLTPVNLSLGIRLLGGGALLLALWLLRYDIARHTIRKNGLARYIAACLLLGYGWLGIGGAIGLWKGALYAGPDYAALLHAFLLGFVFSMIFGHAPIILPAVTGLRLEYRPLFYLPLVLLHVTLLYRMYGYLTLDYRAQEWGGLLNVIAILLFLAMTAIAIIRSNLRVGAIQDDRALSGLHSDT